MVSLEFDDEIIMKNTRSDAIILWNRMFNVVYVIGNSAFYCSYMAIAAILVHPFQAELNWAKLKFDAV